MKERKPMSFDCGELKNSYTDNRGLPINDQDIKARLNCCGLTESKVIDFIGPIFCQKKGFVWHFLGDLATKADFYRDRD